MTVCARLMLTLQYTSLPTFNAMFLPFFVVPILIAVNTVSATPAQCTDGAQETHLKYVSCELYQTCHWSRLSSVDQSSGRY